MTRDTSRIHYIHKIRMKINRFFKKISRNFHFRQFKQKNYQKRHLDGNDSTFNSLLIVLLTSQN